MIYSPISQDHYDSILIESGQSITNCEICNRSIWYPTTKFKVVSDRFVHISTTHLTKKVFGNTEYSLVKCYLCLLNKFSDVASKNPSKLFNTCNAYGKYAFSVTDSDYLAQRKTHGITREKLVSKYGIEDGNRRWDSYVAAQRDTNLYSTKAQKYGWSPEDFKEFNKSRAVTLSNLKKKHGDIEGERRWLAYLEKQKHTKSLQYLIEKYGVDKATAINSSKALTEDNFIRKYGESGKSKYAEYVANVRKPVSLVSQEFFKSLDDALSKFNLTTYYNDKNSEYSKRLSTGAYCKLDYYIAELKLAIEYYGDFWHANPKLYESSRVLYSGKTASVIQKENRARLIQLKKDHSIDSLIVWQYDDTKNRHAELTNIVNYVELQIRKNSKS